MSDGTILVLNAGSSSIKFSIFTSPGDGGGLTPLSRGRIRSIGTEKAFFHAENAHGDSLIEKPIPTANSLRICHEQALNELIGWLEGRESSGRLQAIGHRIVHGGHSHFKPVRMTSELLETLEALIPLAPLHQPHNLNAVHAISKLKPGLLQVACFDTAFHHDQPWAAQAFALPREYWDAGVRRYGFHGLSYEYIAGVLPDYLGEEANGRVVVAHLGNGASMCAMRDRHAVATTMGFTALDGLPMGTRCGALDPGLILYLLQERHMSLDEVTDLLYRRSGLLGVSGISNDMRDLLASDAEGAAQAIDLFVYRIGRELGSLAAALGGLDALVFTGGIGEHAAPIRARVCRDAEWLGITLDQDANNDNESRISRSDSASSVWVIPTNEEIVIARHTKALLGKTKHQV